MVVVEIEAVLICIFCTSHVMSRAEARVTNCKLFSLLPLLTATGRFRTQPLRGIIAFAFSLPYSHFFRSHSVHLNLICFFNSRMPRMPKNGSIS